MKDEFISSATPPTGQILVCVEPRREVRGVEEGRKPVLALSDEKILSPKARRDQFRFPMVTRPWIYEMKKTDILPFLERGFEFKPASTMPKNKTNTSLP